MTVKKGRQVVLEIPDEVVLLPLANAEPKLGRGQVVASTYLATSSRLTAIPNSPLCYKPFE